MWPSKTIQRFDMGRWEERALSQCNVSWRMWAQDILQVFGEPAWKWNLHSKGMKGKINSLDISVRESECVFLPFCNSSASNRVPGNTVLSGCSLLLELSCVTKQSPDLSPRVRDYFGKWQGMMMGKTLTLSVLLSWSPLWATWAWSLGPSEEPCRQTVPRTAPRLLFLKWVLTHYLSPYWSRAASCRVWLFEWLLHTGVRPWGRNEETRGVVLLAGMFPCDSCVKIVAIAMGGQSS